MKKSILISIITLCTFFFLLSMAHASQGQEDEKASWDEIYVNDLGKIKNPDKTDGLGYTLSEEEALEQAIKRAIDKEAPACQVLKIGVEMKFNPYTVLSGIFNAEAKIDLEQLCLCATETGDSSIPKTLMLKAANDAVAKNRLRRDEVTQAQCLQQGLGFTVAQETPDPINPTPRLPTYSPF